MITMIMITTTQVMRLMKMCKLLRMIRLMRALGEQTHEHEQIQSTI